MINHRNTLLASLSLCLLYTVPVSGADQVDSETFVGWRLYHDTCVTCHGVGGVGSDLAPDLTESVQRLSEKEFELKVLNRYLLEVPVEESRAESRAIVRDAFLKEIQKHELGEETGMPMPEWKHNPIVADHIEYVYRYLKARSTGAIGPGKPEIMKE